MATPAQRWVASPQPAELMADALPIKDGEAPLEELVQLEDETIELVCTFLVSSFERALKERLRKILGAKRKAGSAAAKFEVVAMSSGDTANFYEGIEGRVGELGAATPAPAVSGSSASGLVSARGNA